jgi:SAM-dependent methyltransferase
VNGDAGVWRCPRCRGGLVAQGQGLECRDCAARYPVVAGLPDLRVAAHSAIDPEADAAEAVRLAREADRISLEELIRRALSSRSPAEWSEARLALRTRQSLQGPLRMRSELQGWLHPWRESAGLRLDAGCGFGGLMAAAAAAGGPDMIGVDASLVNLVVARRVLAESGRPAVLAAGLVEHLPLADASLAGVVSLDVLEHVADAAVFAGELARVTQPGGVVALSTPNRFSLAAEPHVGAWGVGLLPRAWQAHYVRWRTGIGYEQVRLLSAREIRRLLERAGFSCAVEAAPVPDAEMAAFSRRRRALARLYNGMAGRRGMRVPLRLVGPFFHVVARKPVEPLSAQAAVTRALDPFR